MISKRKQDLFEKPGELIPQNLFNSLQLGFQGSHIPNEIRNVEMDSSSVF
jgi:hypothetical protein